MLFRSTLNKYYTMTDLSEVYRIAMGMYIFIISATSSFQLIYLVVLHPRHKLNYFENANWDIEWVQTTRQMVWDEYDRSYKKSPATDSTILKTTLVQKRYVMFQHSSYLSMLTFICRQKTFLTASPRFAHQKQLISVTNSIAISALTQSILLMRSCGGQSESTSIRAYHGWRWTISQSLVCGLFHNIYSTADFHL